MKVAILGSGLADLSCISVSVSAIYVELARKLAIRHFGVIGILIPIVHPNYPDMELDSYDTELLSETTRTFCGQ